MHMVMHRTSVVLDNALYESWRQSGLPLADLIRRGLASFTAAPAPTGIGDGGALAVLARIESHLAALLDRTPVVTEIEPLTPEERAQMREESARLFAQQERELAEGWHDELVAPDQDGDVVLTAAEAAVRLGLSPSAARDRLIRLQGHGLAERAEDSNAPGHPHLWRIVSVGAQLV